MFETFSISFKRNISIIYSNYFTLLFITNKSTKKNIQSIFPFRKNIWSQDVVTKLLNNQNIEQLLLMSKNIDFGKNQEKSYQIILRKIDTSFTHEQKLNLLLDSNLLLFCLINVIDLDNCVFNI
jgi:hypothetical protein